MKISVCMAVYSGERFLKQQLESILSQLHADDEVVLVNDKSTDSSLAVINALGDTRIHILNNAVNVGAVASFERALSLASGNIIFFSDQDDIWMPNKVKHVLEIFDSNPDVLAVVSNAALIDELGQSLNETHFAVRHSGPGVFKNWYRNSYVGCCMAIRSCVKDVVLPFPKRVPMHDAWIGSVCDLLGSVKFTTECLVQYRRHAVNATELVGTDPTKMLKKRMLWLWIFATRLPGLWLFSKSKVNRR